MYLLILMGGGGGGVREHMHVTVWCTRGFPRIRIGYASDGENWKFLHKGPYLANNELVTW